MKAWRGRLQSGEACRHHHQQSCHHRHRQWNPTHGWDFEISHRRPPGMLAPTTEDPDTTLEPETEQSPTMTDTELETEPAEMTRHPEHMHMGEELTRHPAHMHMDCKPWATQQIDPAGRTIVFQDFRFGGSPGRMTRAAGPDLHTPDEPDSGGASGSGGRAVAQGGSTSTHLHFTPFF